MEALKHFLFRWHICLFNLQLISKGTIPWHLNDETDEHFYGKPTHHDLNTIFILLFQINVTEEGQAFLHRSSKKFSDLDRLLEYLRWDFIMCHRNLWGHYLHCFHILLEFKRNVVGLSPVVIVLTCTSVEEFGRLFSLCSSHCWDHFVCFLGKTYTLKVPLSIHGYKWVSGRNNLTEMVPGYVHELWIHLGVPCRVLNPDLI